MARITFLPSDIEVECEIDETIFEVAKKVNIEIPAACSGVGNCGLCIVCIVEGENCVNSISPIEVLHLGNTNWITHKRLACQSKCVKDGKIVVEVL